MMLQLDELIYIGQMAVFYVPVQKLDEVDFGEDGLTPRAMFERFLMDNYNAYTLEISDTQGFWRKHQKSHIFEDKNARYEVSFDGKERVVPFVQFLSRMCSLMREEAIYLTMGQHSWLVVPRKENNEVRATIPTPDAS